jgi:hypothetical protein
MMEKPPQRFRLPEWLADPRAEPRWREAHTVLAQLREDEYLGKTRDLSCNGAGVALQGVCANPGETIRLQLVLGQTVLGLGGRVVHSRPTRWGSVVGIRREVADRELEEFLGRHYTSDAEGLGSVT